MNVTNTKPGAVLTSCFFILALIVGGCSSSGQAIQEDEPEDEVSVGYGTQPRENVTGSVSSVDADKETRPIARVEEMLEGVSGVRLMRSQGGGIRVQIRGPGSIYGNNEPLYVVDGMPIEVEPGQGLNWLNPSDIKTIEVLKDGSSTAIYGSRGANGVVIIKTRRD